MLDDSVTGATSEEVEEEMEKLVCAVQVGNVAALEEWLAKGNDASFIYHGQSLLQIVVRVYANSCHGHDFINFLHCGLMAALSLLLRHDADVNRADSYGMTPLYRIASPDRFPRQITDVARLLLDAGAAVDARTNSGCTPLINASLHNNCDMIRILMSRGASPLVRAGGRDAEAWVRFHREEHGRSRELAAAAYLLADVRAAGGWKAYVRAPRVRLLVLRHFCAEGKAAPPMGDDLLQRLFSRHFPKEIFYLIFRYWRTPRDDP